MSRVVMFVLNDMRADARVIREAATLAGAGHAVTVVARTAGEAGTAIERDARDGFVILRVPVPGRGRRFALRLRRRPADRGSGARPAGPGRRGPWRLAGDLARGLLWLVRWRFGVEAWAAAAAAAAPAADVWHGHDLPGLIAAARARLRRGGRLVYDVHELYLEAGATATVPAWARRVVGRLERRLVRGVDAVITVNGALGAVLRGTTEGPIVVIHNCPPRWSPPSSGGDGPLRAAAAIAGEEPVALYHGSFAPHRGIEALLAALAEPGCESIHAVFMGSGALEPMLRAAAASDPRIHVLAAVDPVVLTEWVAGADVGVVAIAPSTLNHRLSTPNKLFECIAAGVPVVVSDFGPMREVVCHDPAGPLGVTCDPGSAASVAQAIVKIVGATPADRAELRRRCLQAAHERWNWERESERLVGLYRAVLAA